MHLTNLELGLTKSVAGRLIYNPTPECVISFIVSFNVLSDFVKDGMLFCTVNMVLALYIDINSYL